jgi:hypothetical protein
MRYGRLSAKASLTDYWPKPESSVASDLFGHIGTETRAIGANPIGSMESRCEAAI